VICGPTASGKTAVAVELCRQINGEIISADSMQVYRQLSIGTAKPTPEELRGVPCHLIDHVSPDEQYNLGRFVDEASRAIEDVRGRGCVPVICGGTGMYIRGLLHGVFEGGEPALNVRQELEAIADERGLEPLFRELEEVDAQSAARYGPSDRQRIIRALEVFRSTGKPFSQYHAQALQRPLIPAMIYVLTWPREKLYDRINRRVDAMVDAGILEEIRSYLAQGFRRDNPALNALGYNELIHVIDGRLSLDGALEVMKRKSRNYAKRQETWFRAVKDAIRLDADAYSSLELAAQIKSDWQKTAD
jgi:tRNA dimethylallyltransferase